MASTNNVNPPEADELLNELLGGGAPEAPEADEADEADKADKTAKASKSAKAAKAAKQTPAEPVPPEKDLVSFFAIKDKDKYKDDIVVAVNGKAWRIKRGVQVMIPRFVAAVLENSQRQDIAAAEIMTQEAESFRLSRFSAKQSGD